MRAIRHCLLALTFALPAAHAQQGSYIGFGVGTSSGTLDPNSIVDGSTLTGRNFEESGTYASFAIGMRFGQGAALEIGYANLGEMIATASSNGTGSFWFAGPIEAKLTTKAFYTNVVASVPLADTLGLLGRIGYYSADTEYALTDACCTIISETSNGGMMYGLGMAAAFSERLSARLEYIKFLEVEAVGLSGKFTTDIDVLSASLILGF